ncbi:MAG: OmpA family protein [Sphingobium sp.]|nr:OmpA family protein [Sphingobium sp.]
MAGPDDRRDGAPSHIHIEKKKSLSWLPWLLLALGLLALLFALSRCDRNNEIDNGLATDSGDNAAAAANGSGEIVASTPGAGASAALGTSALAPYLGGNEPVPRTFTFEKLNFDSAKSDIRAADAAEISHVATTLAKYPGTKVRIAGYADDRGAEPANVTLGKARADSVKAALVAKGIAPDRIETASGGEQDPVDTNATAGGRFENRRTELIVISR